MRLPAVRAALRGRIRRPGPWVAAAGSAGLLLAAVLSVHSEPFRWYLPPVFALVAFTVIFLLPMAWQWTGDDLPLDGFLKGILKSAVILVPVLLLLKLASGAFAFHAKLLLGLALAVAVLAPFGYFQSRWELHGERTRAEVARAREAEWASLRGPVDPATVLARLEALALLAAADPAAAEGAILRLSAEYRAWLDEAGSPGSLR